MSSAALLSCRCSYLLTMDVWKANKFPNSRTTCWQTLEDFFGCIEADFASWKVGKLLTRSIRFTHSIPTIKIQQFFVTDLGAFCGRRRQAIPENPMKRLPHISSSSTSRRFCCEAGSRKLVEKTCSCVWDTLRKCDFSGGGDKHFVIIRFFKTFWRKIAKTEKSAIFVSI